MPRRLIVMRHAKSSWESDAPDDHERPLNKRGLRDAPRIGRHLRELGWVPDLVLSSDALRTRQTYYGLCEGLEETIPAIFTPNLYHGGYQSLLDEAASVPEEVQTLLVLGHNPGWQELVKKLSGSEVPMKTATAVLLTLPDPVEEQGKEPSDWVSALRQGTWQIADVLEPRKLSD